MPSVGMRRRTRVFGGARVLRSGRCLWPESDESKVKKRQKVGEDWLLNVENERSSYTRNGTNAARVGLEREVDPMDVEEGQCDKLELGKRESLDDRNEKVPDKMYGLVYSRKRKRHGSEEKNFGISFCRWQMRRKSMDENKSLAVVESSGGEAGYSSRGLVLALYVGPFHLLSGSSRNIYFADLLFSVLSYLRKKRVSLQQLFKFLMSNPISSVCGSHGIRLLQDPPTNSFGICNIFGARQLLPLFSVDFSAVPLWFMYMHSSMLLRYRFAPAIYVYSPVMNSVDGIVIFDKKELRECNALMLEADNLENKSVLHPSVSSTKLAQTAVYRNGVYSRCIQKRRSLLRSGRRRNSPLVSIDKPNGSLVSDLINRRRNGVPFSSVAPARLAKSTSVGSFREASSALVGSKCCFANILIIESDRCYREEGAVIILEISDSDEWVLSVKRDGLPRYSLKAQKVMRPSSSNRVTHHIIWTADTGWKLEFPRCHDWMVFKDLYRECFNRNVPLSLNAKPIPVPGVRVVSGYCDQNIYTYSRPDSYITMKNDELSRTLAKRTASYDMDVEDEEWLSKLNDEIFGAHKLNEHLTPENFELMIDAFEKAYYCCPDDISDDKAAAKFCSELGQKDLMEAVYSYWMKKRKQKRSALVRVFQFQQPRRASLIPKPALRKKRSIKRQGNQCGRGKQPNCLQAMAVEQIALVQQKALQRVEELKASVNKSLESAILKRKRAQFLMDNADLATYRATMALVMAEAAQYAETLDSAAGPSSLIVLKQS